MIRNLTITKVLICVIALTLSSCSSWHYKHSRVRVEQDKSTSLPLEAIVPLELATIPMKNKVELKTKEHTNVTDAKQKNAELTKVNNKTTPVVTNTKSSSKSSLLSVFTNNIKKIGKAFKDPKTVEKSTVTGWVRIMIILFVIGFILILIGIFLTVFISGAFWWLFYGLGALCIIAAVIVLILGLLGLI